MNRRNLHVLGFAVTLCLIGHSGSGSGVAAAAAPDIVLYASDVSHMSGWLLVSDSTAAGGLKLSSDDNGWSSTEAPPPPSSAPVASFAIDVPATGNYRLWLRMKGKDNSKWNESVWVQFSNATRNGTEVYRWGTNQALLVNLENCLACGIQQWGWQDNSWWLNQSPVVTLRQGPQFVYVGIREDGVEFDQIVLSPERYLNSAPGAVKNDTTVLDRSTAERIIIQQGALLDMGRFDPGQLTVTGTNGFSLTSLLRAFDAAQEGQLDNCQFGCAPGQETAFRAYWTGFEVGLPNVSYRGTQYPVNGFDDLSGITLLVSGHLRTPDAIPNAEEGQTVTVTAPFHFGEVLTYVGEPGEPTGRALLVGGGMATLTLRWSVLDEGWYFDSADFTFIDPGGAPPSPTEIVLYASDVAALSGLALVNDATAAGGRKITSTDEGRDWLNTVPPPNAAPYATFAFNVVEGGDYRVWLRLRGQANSKWNESVWIQFSNARRGNAPVYQWGSNDGLLVNLEDCWSCGIQSWGWQDNSWWLNQSSLISLSAGMQTLYVTLREDGVEFDQIVLSRERYVSQPPGPVKNDTTIVPKPATINQIHADAGTIAFDGRIFDLSMSGPEGFSLTTRFAVFDGAPEGVFVCYQGGCVSESRVPISGFWLGGDFRGDATYRGQTYDFRDEPNGGEIRFRGFVTMPAAGPSTAVVVAPFTVTGTVWYSTDGLSQQTLNYLGGGQATFHLTYEAEYDIWSVESAEFAFSRP